MDYETVATRNPAVVYASISGYGQHGAWRSRSAYAPTVQAETGITATSAAQFGLPDEQLKSDALSHADVYAGLHAAIAILAALHRRDISGKGEHIDIAMAAVMLAINERVHVDISDYEFGAETPVLGATDCAFFTAHGGQTFVSPMSLVGSMSFPLYLAAMRRTSLAEDPRFRTPEARRQHLAELHAMVQDWIWTFDDLDSLNSQLDEATRDVRNLAARMRDLGVKPELEIYDTGHLDACLRLRDEGLLDDEPLQFSIVLGVRGGMAATPANLLAMVNRLPAGAVWQVIAIGRANLELTAKGLAVGGNARAGLEDTLYLRKGELSQGNRPLVARAARLASAVERPPASVEQTKRLLGLANEMENPS